MARLTVRPHRELARLSESRSGTSHPRRDPGRCAGTDRFSASQFERGVSGRLGTRRSDGQASRATRSELAVLEHHVSDVPPTAEGVRPSRLAPTFAATPLQHRDAVVIAIAGELDIANAPRAGPPASGGRPRSSRVGRPHGLRVHRFERAADPALVLPASGGLRRLLHGGRCREPAVPADRCRRSARRKSRAAAGLSVARRGAQGAQPGRAATVDRGLLEACVHSRRGIAARRGSTHAPPSSGVERSDAKLGRDRLWTGGRVLR